MIKNYDSYVAFVPKHFISDFCELMLSFISHILAETCRNQPEHFE